MSIRVSSIEEAKGIAQEFLQAYQISNQVDENNLDKLAKKYKVYLGSDNLIVIFNVSGTYAELDLTDPKAFHARKQVPKWHGLRHEEIVEKIPLTYL
jgi:hypothetical protein